MTATLVERLRDQAAECARLGSPLSAGLLAMAVEDLEAGGVVAEVFAGHEDLPGRVVPGLRLLELGASAGLNLRADRFAYRVGGVILGDPASPVRLVEPWVGVPFRDPGRVPPPGTHLTVVWHSAVWQYLEREERARVEAAIAAAVERARLEGTAPLVRWAVIPAAR